MCSESFNKMLMNLLLIGYYIIFTNAELIVEHNVSVTDSGIFHGMNVNQSDLDYTIDKHYFVHAISQETKQTAMRFCFSREMGLVAIGSKKENEILFKFVTAIVGVEKNFFWTSGVKKDDYWYWERTGRRMIYTNWNEGEPNNENESTCVELEYDVNGSTFVWNANNCNVKRYFICEGSSH